MQEKVKIAVCSKNKAKKDAVNKVMSKFFQDFEIISLETNSGVSETPINDEEGLTGCFNRIEDAKKQCKDADLYVSMEGILTQNNFGTYLCGWTVIYNKQENEYYSGCSAKVKIPDEIMNEMDSTKRLSDVVAKFTSTTGDVVSVIGTNGMITHGAYTRTDEFMDSILCAISSKYKILNKD